MREGYRCVLAVVVFMQKFFKNILCKDIIA